MPLEADLAALASLAEDDGSHDDATGSEESSTDNEEGEGEDDDATSETLTPSESEESAMNASSADRRSARRAGAAQLNRRNELGETRLHQAAIQVCAWIEKKVLSAELFMLRALRGNLMWCAS
jgi:hypothetical protein